VRGSPTDAIERGDQEVHAARLGRAGRHGAYLTDGVDLFRVAGVVSGSSGPTTVELENCRTLEMHTYSGHGVMSLGLAPVTARHTHE
jgi:hypothetical protein